MSLCAEATPDGPSAGVIQEDSSWLGSFSLCSLSAPSPKTCVIIICAVAGIYYVVPLAMAVYSHPVFAILYKVWCFLPPGTTLIICEKVALGAVIAAGFTISSIPWSF